jgi:NADP-dependent 3-hydroxy acid dehydrogenase YdfG
MSTATITSHIQREPELLGQTVVVIGGSAGIGFETARRARAEGAKVILTGRNHEPLQRAAKEVEALSTAAFDATDPASLERFFRDLPGSIDRVMVTARRAALRAPSRHGHGGGAPRSRCLSFADAPGRASARQDP